MNTNLTKLLETDYSSSDLGDWWDIPIQDKTLIGVDKKAKGIHATHTLSGFQGVFVKAPGTSYGTFKADNGAKFTAHEKDVHVYALMG